jgi:hypothetical protein
MGIVGNSLDTIEYRLALVDSATPMLMASRTPKGYCLPRARIPKWTRPAEEISDLLRREWQLHTFVLTILPAGDGRLACAVAEMLQSTKSQTRHDLTLQNVDSLPESELDCSERDAIQTVMTGDISTSHSFSRRGWLNKAQQWIRRSVPNRTIEFSENVRQYNAGGAFVLVRLGTADGAAYWIKGTGEPNEHERAWTVELSRLFPEYLPSLIAVHNDWNAWLTEDAGHPLGSNRELELLTHAIESLAELQIRSLDHVKQLAQAGFFDRRLAVVRSHLSEMFAFIDESMVHQTSTKVARLSSDKLREIHATVDHSCHEMEELNIPDCLVNGDINLDNILYDGTRIRFTDWAEGGIGNPFLTAQQIIQHVVREGEHLEWAPLLCEAYKKKWLALLTVHQIDCAIALMPLLAMVDYLHGRGDWLSSPRRQDPSFQAFARTLARCMDRTIVEFSSLGVMR